VEKHYLDHIEPLERQGGTPELVKLLRHCCEEEAHHKEEAAALVGGEKSLVLTAWANIVGGGSAAAVVFAKRIKDPETGTEAR